MALIERYATNSMGNWLQKQWRQRQCLFEIYISIQRHKFTYIKANTSTHSHDCMARITLTHIHTHALPLTQMQINMHRPDVEGFECIKA